MRRNTARLVWCIAPLVGLACGGLPPERVSQDDPRLKPMFDAIARVDRHGMGFTPIGRDVDIRLEVTGRGLDGLIRPNPGYDAMLHIFRKTSRTIGFRRAEGGYEWIWEQEKFEGPREYDTVDGRFKEDIVITYQRVPISGYPMNALDVRYSGPDSALAWRKLTLEVVRPLLQKW